MGNTDIKAVDFPQNFRSENEKQNDDLQGSRELHIQPVRQDTGQQKKNQGKNTQKHVLIFSTEHSTHRSQNDQRPKDHIYDQGRTVVIRALEFIFHIGSS